MEKLLYEGRILLDVVLAVVLGFVIGLERKIRGKEAGIRTHTVVCVGSALLMVVSKYGFGENADTSRVAAQIVSGVGFLGAGMIIYKRNEVFGLTTAAGVWATAGVGMACGGRLYYIAIGATLLLVGTQFLFHARVFRDKGNYSVNIEFVQTKDENLIVKELFGTDRFNHLVIQREEGVVVFKATLNTDKEFSSSQLNDIMEAHSFIRSIERCDNG